MTKKVVIREVRFNQNGCDVEVWDPAEYRILTLDAKDRVALDALKCGLRDEQGDATYDPERPVTVVYRKYGYSRGTLEEVVP